jgi:hypothetical protein
MVLSKDIVRCGGKVLQSVPVSFDDDSAEGALLLISHPREYRKPNYLMAIATGSILSKGVVLFPI